MTATATRTYTTTAGQAIPVEEARWQCAAGVELKATLIVATEADAKAIAADLPKSARAYGTTLTRPATPGGSYLDGSETVGYVAFSARLHPDRTTGARNEAGVKRFRTLRRALERHGITLDYRTPYANSATEAEAEAIAAGTAY